MKSRPNPILNFNTYLLVKTIKKSQAEDSITIIQSYFPSNVAHARLGGLGDGVQKLHDKCPGVPDAPKSANKSGQYGVGRGKVRETRAHASVISQ